MSPDISQDLGESEGCVVGSALWPRSPSPRGPYRSCRCFHIAAVVKKEPKVTVFLDGRCSVCCNWSATFQEKTVLIVLAISQVQPETFIRIDVFRGHQKCFIGGVLHARIRLLWVEREVGGGIGMGNTCKSMADSFQCMTKSTTIKKSKANKRIRLLRSGLQRPRTNMEMHMWVG